MHELSLVSELVDECCRRADGEPVAVVRVHCSMHEADGELQQAFLMMTAETPLDGAVLELETVPPTVECACGYSGSAGDGLVGHLFVCPQCAQVGPVRFPSLELLEVRMAEPV